MSITIYYEGWDKEPTKTVRLVDLYEELDNSEFEGNGHDVDDQGFYVTKETTAKTMNLANGNFASLCNNVEALKQHSAEDYCGELDVSDTRLLRAQVNVLLHMKQPVWLEQYLKRLTELLDDAVERNVGIYWC